MISSQEGSLRDQAQVRVFNLLMEVACAKWESSGVFRNANSEVAVFSPKRTPRILNDPVATAIIITNIILVTDNGDLMLQASIFIYVGR